MKISPVSDSLKLNPPVNCLIMVMPKAGIRPILDGWLQGVRESLEKAAMNVTKNVARFIESMLRHSNGLRVECVIAIIANLTTLAAVLRIPVHARTVDEEKVSRPGARTAFEMADTEGADFRAHAKFGPTIDRLAFCGTRENHSPWSSPARQRKGVIPSN
jgi:hypothetical protein